VFGNYKANQDVMIPMWFFIALIVLICYLLYVTRTTEETIVTMSRERLKRFQYWCRGLRSRSL
jgi:hypothetical protein